MHKLFQGARNHPPAQASKPLPEPLVDPDEGKTPIGELVIVPIQGRDLPNRERFGKQNPFTLFKLGNVTKKSSTDVRGGQRPRWKDDQINILMYESDAKDATSLYVTCLDDDHPKNELIGDCVINLTKVLEQGEQDDWFELHYKGREAGELMLQLTYYSYDPTNPTNRMNRLPTTPVPSSGGPARRPIYPPNEAAHHRLPSTSSVVATATTTAYIAEPPTTPAPAVTGGYSTAGYPAGGRVSPSGPTHYAGAPIPPNAQCGANPYAAVNGYPDYPSTGVYPPLDTNKRLSLPNQPHQQFYPPQQGGGGYPPVGYNNPAGGYPPQPMQSQGGYPPQFNTINGYPPQQNSFNSGYPPQQNNFNTGYPPQFNNNNTFSGYPPQQPFNNNANSNIYPPLNNGVGFGGGGLYPPVQQPLSRPASAPGGVGYPPVGYPFMASNLYPPTNIGYPPQAQQSQQQQQQQQSPAMSIPTPATSIPSSQTFRSTLPGSFPGAFPGSDPYASPNTNSNDNGNSTASTGHRHSVSNGYSTSTLGQSSSALTVPGEYPRSSSAGPPALPPRNQHQPPSYTQTMYGSGRI
ncbi:hypothetical protein EDD21DRAFT_385055 [Dissophora ornata]|nr:hypothetical protein BGZ58_004666 [Dissophora ornata]KAI8597600.1 hypothetical protein EDD21DRAFT_385055 [Dissophora ornata]